MTAHFFCDETTGSVIPGFFDFFGRIAAFGIFGRLLPLFNSFDT
jgi:hypothetical protein